MASQKGDLDRFRHFHLVRAFRTVGEQTLASGVRRRWIASGVPKQNVTFCGYWTQGGAH